MRQSANKTVLGEKPRTNSTGTKPANTRSYPRLMMLLTRHSRCWLNEMCLKPPTLYAPTRLIPTTRKWLMVKPPMLIRALTCLRFMQSVDATLHLILSPFASVLSRWCLCLFSFILKRGRERHRSDSVITAKTCIADFYLVLYFWISESSINLGLPVFLNYLLQFASLYNSISNQVYIVKIV